MTEFLLDCNVFMMNDESNIMQHHYFKHGKPMSPNVKESLEKESGKDYMYTPSFIKNINNY